MRRGLYRGFEKRSAAAEVVPGTCLARARSSLAQLAITTEADLTGLVIAFTMPDRDVEVELDCPYAFVAAAGAIGTFKMTDASNVEKARTDTPVATTTNMAFVIRATEYIQASAIPAGTLVTRKARLLRGAGTGNVGNNVDVATIVSQIKATVQ